MSISRAIVATLIALRFFLTEALSQQFAYKAFKTLNVADGLPQSFISSLVQDNTGFIWIGTRDGLARYDGRKFKIFGHVPGDTTTLFNNVISNLYLDKQDRLWIVYEAGDIDILHTKTEALSHITKGSVFRASYSIIKSGSTIAQDAKGNTWFLCSNGGALVYDLNRQALHFYSDTALALENNKIIGITEKNGEIVLVTDTALVTISMHKKILKVVPYTFHNKHLYNPEIKWKNSRCFFRNTGEIVIQDENRLIIFSSVQKNFTTITLPKRESELVNCGAEDSKGNIFFDYNRTIYILSPENKLSIWKPKEDNSPLAPKSMMIDRSGILWLGGNGSGIQMYDLRLSRWAAAAYKKNFHVDILQTYLKVPASEIKNTFLYNMGPYRLRWAKSDSGKIWLSIAGRDHTEQPGLCYYKEGHLTLPHWHYIDTSVSSHTNINAIALSQSGKLWGMDFFLHPVYFNTLTNAVTVYPSIALVNFEQDYTVNTLLINGEDMFWISTALNGLYCYNKQTNKTIHYSEASGSLPTNQLMNLIQDADDANILWIGSLGGGLIKFNKITGKCRAYTTSDGLPNNTVYAVIADSTGILWCSSNKGIFSFNPKTLAVHSFISKDGLPGDEFNRYHFLQLPDGQIAFGGVDGYTVFNPLSIANDTFQPFVALTGIHINNTPADFGFPASPFKKAINSIDEITLPYNQNFLTFEFAGLEYNITEKLQYRYRLEGFNEGWVNAGNENVGTYTNIPPGHYLLQINATNTAGIWSNHIKTLSVIIQPPFWKTWWFTAIWAMAAAALVYFIIYYRIAGVRKEEQQKASFEREASELKAQALRAQMNPHFIFNCLNSIKALIQEDSKKQAVIYLTTFSKLIRNQLNNAQLKVNLYDELETCRMYTQLEALRFGSKIICEFRIEENIDIHSIQVPPLILQPFIENAIWHGILPRGGGHVMILVSEQGGDIKCAIEDDGIGRHTSLRNKSQTSATYQSKGMKLVQGRLNLHNIITNQGGTIELIDKKDKDGNGSGTLVILKFKKEA